MKDLNKYNFAVLNELRDLAYEESKLKGWHSNEVPPEEVDIAPYIANLHGEISELWEAYRKHSLFKECDKADKMREHGLEVLSSAEEEIADVIVRALDLSSALGIDLEKAVKGKLLFNRTRAHRNGGRKV